MKGFVLIEVLLGTAIAGMIFAGLSSVLFQVNRASARSDNIISFHSRVSAVRYQLTRDIVGAFIPVQSDVVQKTIDGQKKALQRKAPQVKGEQLKVATPKADEKKQPPIEHVFYATQAEDTFKQLALVTNNPMQVYWSERSGKPKPRVARVVYRLDPEIEHPESFVLMRQEGGELDLKKYKEQDLSAIRSYELIDGIKSLSFTFVYIEPVQEERAAPGTKKKQEESPKIVFKQVREWDAQLPEKDAKKRMPLLPHSVQVQLELWDLNYKKVRTFEFIISLPTDERQQVKQALMPFAPPPKPKPPTPAKQPPKLATQRARRQQQKRPPLMIGFTKKSSIVPVRAVAS